MLNECVPGTSTLITQRKLFGFIFKNAAIPQSAMSLLFEVEIIESVMLEEVGYLMLKEVDIIEFVVVWCYMHGNHLRTTIYFFRGKQQA